MERSGAQRWKWFWLEIYDPILLKPHARSLELSAPYHTIPSSRGSCGETDGLRRVIHLAAVCPWDSSCASHLLSPSPSPCNPFWLLQSTVHPAHPRRLLNLLYLPCFVHDCCIHSVMTPSTSLVSLIASVARNSQFPGTKTVLQLWCTSLFSKLQCVQDFYLWSSAQSSRQGFTVALTVSSHIAFGSPSRSASSILGHGKPSGRQCTPCIITASPHLDHQPQSNALLPPPVLPA